MTLETYYLYWAPEGRCIAKVRAASREAAIRKTPKPYSKYKGEVYAQTETERQRILEGFANDGKL